MECLDDPKRIHALRARIQSKSALKKIYLHTYQKYLNCLEHCPKQGLILELGSGAGFLKTLIPNVITSDVIAYPGVDQIIDATHLPFPDQSLRAIFLNQVFHHIPDVERFLKEVDRCLIPGGRLLMVEPFPGFLSSLIYRYLHHEPFDPEQRSWSFKSDGPLSSANSALPWIVFQRDYSLFQKLYPNLTRVRFETHSPLLYWLSGGLKFWTLLPGFFFKPALAFDRFLIRLSKKLASFVDIELVKQI